MTTNRSSRRARDASRFELIAREVLRKAKRIFVTKGSKEDCQSLEKNIQPMAEIYLKGGKSIRMPYAESNKYIANNMDKLEHRKIKTRRAWIEADED